MKEDIFDFGFTVVGADELDEVQSVQSTNQSVQSKLDTLYNAIQPLLTNLKSNPDKDYIKWLGKDRIKKIEEFEKYINDIVN